MTIATDNETVARIAPKFQNEVWITNDGRSFYPQDMTTPHIVNTVAMIEEGRMAKAGRTKCSGIPIDTWVTIFKEELMRRVKETKVAKRH